MVELPESIYAQTLRPVVTIIGGQRIIDQINKQIIITTFDQRMDYESLEFSHNLEVRRDTKVFEKYVSQGILKLSWTTKCRKFVPACILLVFDWSGQGIDSPTLESPEWRAKETTILRYLRKFKEQCKGRLVKIAILCLVGSTNEDISIEERLASLKKNGEIDVKGLVIVKSKIDDPEVTSKLKKFLWEGCISHYKDEIDRIKKLKSRAHKELSGNYAEIQLRYNFKLGYYSELKQDKDTALNFYKKCYKEVQESTFDPSVSFDEKRAMADLILHRIQCLLLCPPHLLVRLKEAIGLFKTHLTAYKFSKTVLVFDQYRWLSEHFSRFGGLVEKIPTEIFEKDNFWTHPGFYYQTAGIYFILRMKLTVEDPDFLQSVQNWQAFMSNNELRIKDPLYIGQYKSLASHPLQKDMIEGMSIGEQVKVIKILEEAEVKHLPIALDYLFKALKFYKGTMPMGKISLFLSYLLASLYKKKGENESNYQCKYEIVQKIDGWGSIQEDVLEDLVEISESGKKIEDLIMWTLKSLEINSNKQSLMFEKLKSTLSSNLVNTKTKGIIQAKAKFGAKTITAYSYTTLNITFVSTFQLPLGPLKLSLIFSEASFNCGNFEVFSLEPNKPYKLTHSLVIKDLNVQTLYLLKVIARYEPYEFSWIDFEVDSKAKLHIISPQPQLSPTFNHLPPALIGENYVINVKLHPYSELSSIKMTIYEETKDSGNRRRASIDREYTSSYIINHNDEKISEEGVTIEKLESAQTVPLSFIFYEEKSYILKVKFQYNVHKPNDIIYKWEDLYDLDITVQPPFNFKFRWSFLQDPRAAAVLNVRLWNMCSSPIYLYKISLVPETEWLSLTTKEYEKLEIDYGVSLSEDFETKFLITDSPCVLNGDLLVSWSRKEGVVNDCRVPLTSVTTSYSPLDLIVNVKSEVALGQLFEMQVIVKNKTKIYLEGRLVVQESPAFLLGGIENAKIEIREEEEKQFVFSLVACETGLHDLPKVVINLVELSKTWQGKALIIP